MKSSVHVILLIVGFLSISSMALAQQGTYQQRAAEIDLRYSRHLAFFDSHCDNLMNPKCPEWYNVQIAIIGERQDLDHWFEAQGGTISDIRITEFPAETVDEDSESGVRVEIPTANQCVRIINNREVGDYIRLKNICDAPILVNACYTIGTSGNVGHYRCRQAHSVWYGGDGDSLVGNKSGTIMAGATVIGPEIFETYHELVVMACERHPEHNPQGGVGTDLSFTGHGQNFRCAG